jgi:hypothetical protein
MTRPENNTDASLPLVEAEYMLPARATSVMPIIRMAHSSASLVSKPSSELKSAGVNISARALIPKTIDPARNTCRTLFAARELFISYLSLGKTIAQARAMAKIATARQDDLCFRQILT